MKKTKNQSLNPAIKMLALSFLAFCLSSCSVKETEYVIRSPDNNISVYFWISDNMNAWYRVEFSDKVILNQSKLGIIREDEDFSKNLSIESVSRVKIVKTDYEMLQGKRHHCSYAGNKRLFHLKNASGKKMDIVFQVSNDGAAFRYIFPEKSKVILGNILRSMHIIGMTMVSIFFLRIIMLGWQILKASLGMEQFQFKLHY